MTIGGTIDPEAAHAGFTTTITKLTGSRIGVAKGKRISYGDRGVVITPAGWSPCRRLAEERPLPTFAMMGRGPMGSIPLWRPLS